MSLRPLLGVKLLCAHTPVNQSPAPRRMDLWIIAAVAMLVVWGVGTFALGAPGWVHFLLTLGVFLLIYRIVARGTPAPPRND